MYSIIVVVVVVVVVVVCIFRLICIVVVIIVVVIVIIIVGALPLRPARLQPGPHGTASAAEALAEEASRSVCIN